MILKKLTTTIILACFLIGVFLILLFAPLVEEGLQETNLVNAELYEARDLASNSILIQDAKEMKLYTGNYSRIGIYHPGPAILYVLGTGEFLFFDKLKITKTAIAAQTITAYLYNFLWIFFIFLIVAKHENKKVSFAVILMLITIALMINRKFIGGLWMPYLYFMPFAVLQVALASVLTGSLRFLWIALLAGGFLLHGQIAFLIMIPIIFFACCMALISKHPKLFTKNLTSQKDRLSIILSILIIITFIIPLVLHATHATESEKANFLQHLEKANLQTPKSAVQDTQFDKPFIHSLEFMSYFWGIKNPFILLLLHIILLLLYKTIKEKTVFKELLLTSVLMSSAIFFYTNYGIDRLEQKFLTYYYFSTPILLFISFLFLPAQKKYKEKISIFIILLLLLFNISNFYSDKINAYSRNIQYWPNLSLKTTYNKLASLELDKPLVLHLDKGMWESPASFALGLMAIEKRNKEDIICLAQESWVLDAHVENKCSKAIEKRNAHIFVSSSDSDYQRYLNNFSYQYLYPLDFSIKFQNVLMFILSNEERS